MSAISIAIIVAVAAALLIALLVLRGRRRRTPIERRTDGNDSPYVARHDRPYMKPPARDGAGVTDEVATAATDVAGEVLGVAVRRGAAGASDDLQRLKGVGPKFVARLNELGITRFDQLGGLNANEAAHLDERMGPFQGRLERDRVIEQADYLARGDTEGFEEKFGRLG